MKFRTRFTTDEFEREGDLTCVTPSMTQQHFKDECDINTIISHYRVTGVLGDPTDQRQPYFGDFSNVPDLLDAQNQLLDAQVAFDALPSQVRKRFDNSPIAMLEFLQDTNNREEAVKLGLVIDVPAKVVDSDSSNLVDSHASVLDKTVDKGNA